LAGGQSCLCVRGIQEAMRRAYIERDSGRGIYATLAWLASELGELAEAVLKGGDVEEEIADVLAWTLSVANLLGVDAEKALQKKYGHLLGGEEG